MSAAVSAEFNAGLPARTSQKDARRWIERQLRWERTLGTLRGREDAPCARRPEAAPLALRSNPPSTVAATASLLVFFRAEPLRRGLGSPGHNCLPPSRP